MKATILVETLWYKYFPVSFEQNKMGMLVMYVFHIGSGTGYTKYIMIMIGLGSLRAQKFLQEGQFSYYMC